METRNPAKECARHTGAMVPGIIATITVTCSLILLGTFSGMQRVTQAAVFAPQTVIDGVVLGGLSLAQGEYNIQQAEAAQLNGIRIHLSYNGAEKTFGAQELGVSTNAQALLRQAYGRNRNGGLLTDFDLTCTAFSVQSELVLDEARMLETIESFLRANDIPVRDATASFNPAARMFLYTRESAGVRADAAKVANAVKEKLLQEDYLPLAIDGSFTQQVNPVITKEELERNTVLIGSCTTVATDNENRNINIRLMCAAVDGLMIAPGETLSINDLVGQRTEQKGFRAAPSIVDGQLINDIGGGICQLAGTLYNAALLADMEIVERVHHTWPSEYLPIGLDATLNWDNKDLKLKNRSRYPVYISARLEKLTLTVEIYGELPPDGMEIDLENQIVSQIPAPLPEIIYTDELPAGTKRVKVRSRKGYEVTVYRRYWKDGELVRSELISRDHFRAVRGVMLIGTDDIIK